MCRGLDHLASVFIRMDVLEMFYGKIGFKKELQKIVHASSLSSVCVGIFILRKVSHTEFNLI